MAEHRSSELIRRNEIAIVNDALNNKYNYFVK